MRAPKIFCNGFTILAGKIGYPDFQCPQPMLLYIRKLSLYRSMGCGHQKFSVPVIHVPIYKEALSLHRSMGCGHQQISVPAIHAPIYKEALFILELGMAAPKIFSARNPCSYM